MYEYKGNVQLGRATSKEQGTIEDNIIAKLRV
jgi:hypothetical protein